MIAYGAPPELPPPRGHTVLWVGLAFAVVLILACSAVAAYVFIQRDQTPLDGGAPSPSTSAHAQVNGYHLAQPAAIGSFRVDTSQSTVESVPRIRNHLNALYPHAVDSAVTVYVDPRVPDLPVLVGALIGGMPASDQQSAVNLAFTDPHYPFVDVHPVSPGPIGGVARCGAHYEGVDTIYECSWADSVSVGRVDCFDRPIAECEALFPQFRAAVVTRG
jgi:hypothetical protein